MLAAVFASIWLAGALGEGPSPWLSVSFFWVDARQTVVHDARSGVLIRIEGRGTCSDEPGEKDRVRDRTAGREGANSWDEVELDDPALEVRQFAAELSPDKPPVTGSYLDALVRAGTPPPSCRREVQYRIWRADSGCYMLRAVPCSSEQRDRLQQYVRLFVSGRQPGAFNREMFPSRDILPGDLDLLKPGISVDQVLKEFGIPMFSWARYPDAFSWVYSSRLTDSAQVILDFAKDRTLVKVRVVRDVWNDE